MKTETDSVVGADSKEIAQHIENLLHKSGSMRENAAQSLANYAKDSRANQDAIREAGGISRLVDLVNDTQPGPVRQEAVRALANLAGDNAVNQDAIRDMEGIELLVGLLTDVAPDTCRYAVRAIANLVVDNASNQEKIAAAGALVLLLGLLDDDAVSVRENAALAIAILVRGHEANASAVVGAGGIAAFTTLRTDSSAVVRHHAELALAVLRGGEKLIEESDHRRTVRALPKNSGGSVKDDSPVGINTIVVPGGIDSLLNNHYQNDLSNLVEVYRVVCIHGMGGAGKSILAQAESLKEDILYSIRFQITADSDDTLFSGLLDLYAECCDVDERHFFQEELRQEKDLTKQRSKLLTRLRRVLSDSRWRHSLLLLDNCQKETPFLRQMVDTLTDTRFLITTRDKHLLVEYSTSKNPRVGQLSLNEGWDPKERLQFVGEDLGELPERQALVNYLPFPLALKVAAQTIRYLLRNRRRKSTCKKYLLEIRDGLNDSDDENALTFSSEDITQRQTAVLQKSMSLIDSQAGQALLQFLGHVSPFPMPYELVNDYFDCFFSQESKDRRMDLLDEGLRQLQAMSLIDTEMQAEYIQALSIHELVQDITRRKFPLLEEVKEPEVDVMTIMLDTLLAWIRIDKPLLSNEGQRQRVRDAGLHLEALLKNIDSSKPCVGEAYFYLGNSYGDLGDPKKKKDLLERALTIKEAIYGGSHIEVLSTLVDLSRAYGALGDPKKEKELLVRVLAIEEAAYGEDHVEMAKTLNNLGNAYGTLGDPREQKKLLKRALKIKKAHYGGDHIQVVMTQVGISRAYGALGKPNKQKKLLKRALVIYEDAYGENHVEVARVLRYLGNAHGSLGKSDKQKKLLKRALTINESYYGQNHVVVARTLNDLANAHGDLGDPYKKKELLERALKIDETTYGRDHFNVGRTLYNLGNSHGTLGNVKTQKELLERALTIKKSYYGEDHYQVAETLTCLGDVRRELGQYKTSLDSLERALKITEAHYGKTNYEVGKTHRSLGKTFQSLRRFDKAENHFLSAYTIFKNHYGEKHSHTKEVYKHLEHLRQSKQGKPKVRSDIFHPPEEVTQSQEIPTNAENGGRDLIS